MTRRVRWPRVIFFAGLGFVAPSVLVLAGPASGTWTMAGVYGLLTGLPLLCLGGGMMLTRVIRESHAADAQRFWENQNAREAIIEARQPGSEAGALSEPIDDRGGALSHARGGELSAPNGHQDP